MDSNQLINSIFYPRRHNNKDDKDILIKVEDNNSIAIRCFIEDKKYPTIVFFHGNAEICSDYNDIATYYNHYKINIIVSGYRGYGLSSGIPSKDNLHKDSLTVFDFIFDYLKKNNFNLNLIPMGRSLGSASVSHIIKHREKKIKGCIIESGFATEYPLLNLMNINPEDISFTLKDGFENLDKIKHYSKALLVIHADLDDIVPFRQAELIMIECKSNTKELFKVEGANHNNIIMYARDEYFKKIKSFIESL